MIVCYRLPTHRRGTQSEIFSMIPNFKILAYRPFSPPPPGGVVVGTPPGTITPPPTHNNINTTKTLTQQQH